MKSLLKMTWVEGKLFLREPASAFFTLIFPLLMLIIFGTIYGIKPVPGTGSTEAAIGTLIPAFTSWSSGWSV